MSKYYGEIVQIIGSVVDVKFPRHMPPQRELLLVQKSESETVHIEVYSHQSDGVVRCIAFEATEGLSRGMVVENTGKTLEVPVGDCML